MEVSDYWSLWINNSKSHSGPQINVTLVKERWAASVTGVLVLCSPQWKQPTAPAVKSMSWTGTSHLQFSQSYKKFFIKIIGGGNCRVSSSKQTNKQVTWLFKNIVLPQCTIYIKPHLLVSQAQIESLQTFIKGVRLDMLALSWILGSMRRVSSRAPVQELQRARVEDKCKQNIEYNWKRHQVDRKMDQPPVWGSSLEFLLY